jgi:hypothetical protein
MQPADKICKARAEDRTARLVRTYLVLCRLWGHATPVQLQEWAHREQICSQLGHWGPARDSGGKTSITSHGLEVWTWS